MNPVHGYVIGYINGEPMPLRHALIEVYNDPDGGIRMDLGEPVTWQIPASGEFSVCLRVGDAQVPLLAIHQKVEAGARLTIDPPPPRP